MHGRVSAGSVRAHSQAAMVGKALARVMQLQKERDALVRRVQVRSGYARGRARPDAATCRCTAVPSTNVPPFWMDCGSVSR